MSFLERYLKGEYEQVWAELLALGGQIREEPLYSDALAVARETMTRTGKNIEVLVQRLEELDYRFEFPVEVGVIEQDWLEHLYMLEERIGLLPLSIRVFYEIVGGAELLGSHPKLSDHLLDVYSNPLNVAPLVFGELEAYVNPFYGDPSPEGATLYKIDISPDDAGKAGYSGGFYSIGIPDPAMDSPLWNYGGTFVEYLRESFRWGGFPGFKRSNNPPTEELAFLTKDLLPI